MNHEMRSRIRRLLPSWCIVVACVAPMAAIASAPSPTAQDYAHAEKVLDANLRQAIRNGGVDAHWLDEHRFWYRRDEADGASYVMIDAAARTRSPAFDAARLTQALSAFAGKPQTASHLTVVDIADDAGVEVVDLTLDSGKHARCRLDRYECSEHAADAAPGDTLPSPDGKRAVFRRDDNLWLRAGTEERALTRDGEAHFSYGKLPDGSLAGVPAMRSKASLSPIGIEWSPDNRHLLGTRVDERAVAPYPYVEWVPQDGGFRPISYELRLPLLGDAGQPKREAFVLDADSGVRHVVDLGKDWTLADATLVWSPDNTKAYRLAYSYGARDMALVEIDVRSGAVRRVVEDHGKTSLTPNNLFYGAPNVQVLFDTNEVVWFSERSGYGHLYVYDLRSGKPGRALTRGDWLVRDLVHVDAKRRIAWFTASGREHGRDAYYRHLYRVSLDGGEPVLLTNEDAEHDVASPRPSIFVPNPSDAFSPGGRYVIDSYSTVDTPPVTVLRSSDDGHVVMTLEDADVSAVKAAGWRAPQRVRVRSADGKTELYAVVYLPPGFDRGKKYPVIDAFYGGPQMLNAPRSYAEAVSTMNPISRASLAELGFIVVTIDARGTRGRSKAFADVGYGNFADPQIEDHVAAIRELADRIGGFDLDRVGVYGHSFGGYTSARAILSHPEFYKVAVSSAGPHNYQGFYDGLEAFTGIPVYADGSRTRPSPTAVPTNYAALDNAKLAANLRGHLMLVYGDMDENALPAVTLQLADALIKADKRFDLLYLPNRTHSFFRTDAYYVHRMWDYFVEHLLGAEPPANANASAAVH